MTKIYTADRKKPSYLLKIRGGVEVDSYGKKAGKGALIAEEISHTLGTSQDQYLFQSISASPTPIITFEPGVASREGGHIYEGVSGTLRAKPGDNQLAVCYLVENHPADSRVTIDDSGTCQTLTSRMGTGGGNVPLVMFSKNQGEFVVCETYHCNTEVDKTPPLKARDWKDPLIVVYVENAG